MKKIEEEILLKAFEIHQNERRDPVHWRIGIKAFINQLPVATSEDKMIHGINDPTWLSFQNDTQAYNAVSKAYSDLTQYLRSHHVEGVEHGFTNTIQPVCFLALGYVCVVSKKLFTKDEAVSLKKKWEAMGLTCFLMDELSDGADLYASEVLEFTKYKDLIQKSHLTARGQYGRIPGSVGSCLLNEEQGTVQQAQKTINSAFQSLEKQGLAVHVKGVNLFFEWDGISLTREGIRMVEFLKEQKRLDFMAEQETRRGKVYHVSCPSCGEIYFQTSPLFNPTARLTGAMLELLPHLDPAQWSNFSGDDIGDNLACPNCQETLPNYDGFLRPSNLVAADISDTKSESIIDFKVDESDGRVQIFSNSKNEALKLLNAGLSQTDVAKALGIHKATVSKARKRAIDDGFLTPYNKLTQPGLAAVKGRRE